MSTATIAGTSRPLTDAMTLLRTGIPLSLLLDLAMGPHSRELLEQERRTIPAPRRRRTGSRPARIS